jgi:hypothetical protein
MARDIGISRKTFIQKHGWLELRSAALEQLQTWLTQAESEIYPQLQCIGFVA